MCVYSYIYMCILIYSKVPYFLEYGKFINFFSMLMHAMFKNENPMSSLVDFHCQKAFNNWKSWEVLLRLWDYQWFSPFSQRLDNELWYCIIFQVKYIYILNQVYGSSETLSEINLWINPCLLRDYIFTTSTFIISTQICF